MGNIIALVNDQTLQQKLTETLKSLTPHFVWSLRLKGAIAKVADLRPMVVLVELAATDTQWEEIVIALKTNAATRRIGILGLYSARDHAQQAQTSLLDDMLALETLEDTLLRHVEQYARLSDEALQKDIAPVLNQPMPPLVLQGIEAFNRGEYYPSHDYFEQAWMEESNPIRNAYRGILQIAVAYYHIERQNYRGALKMFLRSIQWLEPLPDWVQGIHIAKLRQDAAATRQQMEALGAERIEAFDLTSLHNIQFDPDFIQKEE